MSNGQAEPDIRFVIFTNPAGEPWVCRLKWASTTPKGRVVRYATLNAAEPRELKYDPSNLPPATPDEAWEEYQLNQIRPQGYSPNFRKTVAKQLANILTAEAIRKSANVPGDPCCVCEGETDVTVNINARPVRVCDDCCEAIAMQTMDSLCDKSSAERQIRQIMKAATK